MFIRNGEDKISLFLMVVRPARFTFPNKIQATINNHKIQMPINILFIQ